MKTTYKIISVLFVALLFSNCEENESHSVNNVPFESLSFPRSTILAEVDPASPTYQLEVNVTQPSSVDRTFNVAVVPLAEIPANYNLVSSSMVEAEAEDFSIAGTSVTIPAGEVKGYLTVNFTAANLADGLVKSVGFKLTDSSEDTEFILKKDIVVLNFTKSCDFTKTVLDITFDKWASETSWELYYGAELVSSGGGYADLDVKTQANFCLESGDYTFVLYDSYGDGICCSQGNGSYTIKVDGNVIISGAPTGSQEVKEFTID